MGAHGWFFLMSVLQTLASLMYFVLIFPPQYFVTQYFRNFIRPVSSSSDHLFSEDGIGERDCKPKYLRTEFSAAPTSMLLDLGQTGDVCAQRAAKCWVFWDVVFYPI